MRFNSIRFKTTVLYTGILCFILTIYSAVLFYTVRQIIYNEIDDKLRVKASQIASTLYAYEQVSEIESEPLNLMARFLTGGKFDERNRKIIDNLWYANVKSLNLKDDYILVF